MTVTVEVEAKIARRPEEVYAALLAVEEFPGWLIASGIVSVVRLDDGPLNIGSRVRISQRLAGLSTTLDASVAELQPDGKLALHGRDPNGFGIVLAAAVEPAGDGTRLRWSLELGLPLRYRAFESMVAHQARRAAVLDLESLRRRLEVTTRP